MREYQQYRQDGKYEPFILNDCGVCLNSVEVGTYRFGNICYEVCRILIAQFPDGLWRWGNDVRYKNFGDEGGGSTPSQHSQGYTTQQQAVIEAVRSITKSNATRRPEEMIWINEMLRRAKAEVTELTLF